ncbi:MAG: RidA family protein [Chloroflexota bacterium]
MPETLRFSEVFAGQAGEVVPLAIRVGDALYAWHISSQDPASGRSSGDPVAQMSQAVKNMQVVLQAAGLNIDNVARATGYIRDPANREVVYQPWDALYSDPNDRPAFKVLISDLPPGEEARIQMLAYAGARRTRFDIEGVPARDPTVKVGPWVFSSRVHGTDRTKGNVPSGAESQVKLAYENLKTLIQLAGGNVANIAQITVYMRELDVAPTIETQLRALTEVELPGVAVRLVRSFVRPEMEAMLEMSAALLEGAAVLELSTPLAPGRPRPAGIQIGSLVHYPELRGIDFVSGELMDGCEQQIRQALRNAELALEHAGMTLDNVAQVTVYLRDLEGHPVLNKVWPEFFPDAQDRPPHKYLPAALPDRILAQVHVTAVRGVRRTVLEIPGMKHGDPMSMGVRIGGYIFSSRIVGTDTKTGAMPEDPSEQARLAFQNVQTLLKQANASVPCISQVNAFIPAARYRAVVEDAFTAMFPEAATAPKLNVLQVDLPPGAVVRLEIAAAI